MDSINIYARGAEIRDVVGRADYISSPERQEHLLGVAGIQDPEFWRQLAHDSQKAWHRSGGDRTKKACEAREIHVQLPRKILDLPPEEQQRVADRLSQFFLDEYGLQNITGLHLSKTQKNAHAHVLFSERMRLLEPEIQIADRNAFINEEGIRTRTKKEILGENGQLRPGCKIIKKGEVLYSRHFDEKDPSFAEETWMDSVKNDLAKWINETLQPDVKREVFDQNGPYLAQKKIGKGVPGKKAQELRQWNSNVRKFNTYVKQGVIPEDLAKEIKERVYLSPNQTPALMAAMVEALGGKAAKSIEEAGGRRTKSGPDEAKKRELRELYRTAAEFRKKAKEYPKGSVDYIMYMSQARNCSGQIERLRRQLGYYKSEDYYRRLERISKEIRDREKWLDRRRSSVAYWGNRYRYLDWERSQLKKELAALPIFFATEEEKKKKSEIYSKLDVNKEEIWNVLAEERAARKAYKAEKKQAREQIRELKAERKELRKAWREYEASRMSQRVSRGFER